MYCYVVISGHGIAEFYQRFFFLVKYENSSKTEKNVDFITSEKTKNNAKPHQNPMGLGVQIPHPRGIQKLIPHPHGGGDPIPHGVPMGGGGGAQTLDWLIYIISVVFTKNPSNRNLQPHSRSVCAWNRQINLKNPQ